MAQAVWRYGIINPFLHRHPGQAGKGQVLAEMGRRSYIRKEGRRITLSPETIRKWLTRYRRGGLPVLADKPRKDKGNHRIDQKIIDAMVCLRGDHLRWTLTRMFEHMLEKGIWNGRWPSQAKLYRLAKSPQLAAQPPSEAQSVVSLICV